MYSKFKSLHSTMAWWCKGNVATHHPFSFSALIRIPSFYLENQYAQLRTVFLHFPSSKKWPREWILANDMQGCDFWESSFKACQAVGKSCFRPFPHLPASCLECKHNIWSSRSHPVPWSNLKNGSFWLYYEVTIPALNCLCLNFFLTNERNTLFLYL